MWRNNKNRAGRRARTGQATRQGQDRSQCGATGQGRKPQGNNKTYFFCLLRLAAGQGQDSPQGNGKTGQNVTPQGKARAGHRARTGQITATHWARRGQAAGQGQGRPQGKGRSLGKNRTSRRPRTRQVTGQGHWQDRSQCDATDAGQGRAGQVCHSPGKNAGRRARTGQVTHWAATGQAAGQQQGRPQGKDRAGHRARTRLVAGQGQDRPQCHATGQEGHDRRHTERTGQAAGRAGCRARTGQVTGSAGADRGRTSILSS